MSGTRDIHELMEYEEMGAKAARNDVKLGIFRTPRPDVLGLMQTFVYDKAYEKVIKAYALEQGVTLESLYKITKEDCSLEYHDTFTRS